VPADPERDWQHPWLRVNVLVRDMTHLLRDPNTRSVIKIELNNAIKMREKLQCESPRRTTH